MGAINAFAKTIETITKHPKLLLIPLVIALLIAPISAYLLKDYTTLFTEEMQKNIEQKQEGNVIVEEYGSIISKEDMEKFMDYIKILSFLGVLSALLNAIGQYAIIKGVLTTEKGEEYSLSQLFIEGFRNMIQVFLVNLIIGLIVLAIIMVPLILVIIPLAAGAMTGSEGLLLAAVFLVIIIELPLVFFLVGLSSMAVPIYVIKGSIGAAFECFTVAFKNKLSTLAFGILLLISVVLIMIVPSSFIGLVALGASGFAAQLLLNLIEAPFQALMQAVMSVGGLMLYLELTREKKDLEEEILEEVQREFQETNEKEKLEEDFDI
ncbi:hypothetical protein E3E31_03395 [Thermococcus sp. M39]|uniref:hypothetical protein n=1 Tax=unclassified Thermococcus TaxID=2627626 RepID=UPI00143A4027|nr:MULTISPECIES: hypothetical protein [unclassified Thermococcus]NJE07576.1 hypothetical protein [Thermococcus sp. M39]